MDIHTDIPLKNYTTMRLGGNARFMVEVHTPEELKTVVKNALSQNLPIFVLGEGSNTIVRDEGFAGLVIRNKIMGFDVVSDHDGRIIIQLGAGENWDAAVARSVAMNLSGIEAMSAIPGTCGAAPVQNVGAYGQETADTLVSLEAYDTQNDTIVTLQNADCEFSYRNSIFRSSQKGRYIITSITLELYKTPPLPPFYAALQTYFENNGITIFTPQVIRDAVIAIRSEKLPDPTKTPNTGSFFKNSIVDAWLLPEIQKDYPDVPFYKMPDKQFKIPTGWLIEQTGLKGKILHGMRIHDKNALVLINESAQSYEDLSQARHEIMTAVQNKFRITIEQEPLEI